MKYKHYSQTQAAGKVGSSATGSPKYENGSSFIPESGPGSSKGVSSCFDPQFTVINIKAISKYFIPRG